MQPAMSRRRCSTDAGEIFSDDKKTYSIQDDEEHYHESQLRIVQVRKAYMSNSEIDSRGGKINSGSMLSGVVEIKKNSSSYSSLLRETGRDAPETLYCIGDISLLNRRSVAVVGARKASQYGRWAAFNIGRKLAGHGIVTVSGLAYGCDSEAHKGALSVNGRTIAVLGSGPDVCYPKRNRAIYDSILENGGLIVSEHEPGIIPLPAYFAQRNRIISGLSILTVVTEAGIASGSLITAERAADQGRTVMAVPYNMSSINGIGCNKLIQDGAGIVAGIADILEELGITQHDDYEMDLSGLSPEEKRLLNLVRADGEISLNYAAARTGRKISEINAAAALLEIKGFIVTSLGKLYIAK